MSALTVAQLAELGNHPCINLKGLTAAAGLAHSTIYHHRLRAGKELTQAEGEALRRALGGLALESDVRELVEALRGLAYGYSGDVSELTKLAREAIARFEGCKEVEG
jgi:hypothetical protein